MQALPRRLQSIAQPELDRRTGRYNSTSILYFYENQLRPENLGLSCTEVLKSDDNALEKMHTYIQWLFPTDEPSPHNPRAPVTDRTVKEAFRESKTLKRRMEKAFFRMLTFYKLDYDERTGMISGRRWVNPPSHNYLRISRIIRSLCIAGLNHRATALNECMQRIQSVSQETRDRWQLAYETAMVLFPPDSRSQEGPSSLEE